MFDTMSNLVMRFISGECRSCDLLEHTPIYARWHWADCEGTAV